MYIYFSGLVTLWDTRENRCVMYWKTGASEIGQSLTVSSQSLAVSTAKYPCNLLHIAVGTSPHRSNVLRWREATHWKHSRELAAVVGGYHCQPTC